MSRRSIARRAETVPAEKRALRDELVSAQGNRCGICGKGFSDPALVAEAKAKRIMGKRGNSLRRQQVTVDHVVPVTATRRFYGNVVAAHLRCNRRKADRMPTGCELIWLAVANAGLG